MEVDIGDPIYVQKEAEDYWCEGIIFERLRTFWGFGLLKFGHINTSHIFLMKGDSSGSKNLFWEGLKIS